MEQRDATQPEAAAEERDQERPSIIPPPKVVPFSSLDLCFCDLMWSLLMRWVSHCRSRRVKSDKGGGHVGKSELLSAPGHGCEMQLLFAGHWSDLGLIIMVLDTLGVSVSFSLLFSLISTIKCAFPQMQWGFMRIYLEGHFIMNGVKQFVLVLLFQFLHNALCLTPHVPN